MLFMRTSWLCWCVGMFIGLSLVACGSDVSTTGEAGSGASSSSSSSSSSSGALCMGDTIRCVTSCGLIDPLDPLVAECSNGSWTCPPGTFNELLCFHGPTCPEPLLACEVCQSDKIECNVTPDCLAGCPAVACSSCLSGPLTANGCSCSCSPDGQLTCAPQVCCKEDINCGDGAYVP